jgi:putative cell wall-binding protein
MTLLPPSASRVVSAHPYRALSTSSTAILALLLAALLVTAAALPASATANVSSSRIAGEDRLATAVALAEAGFGSAEDVVIVRDDAFPDALAGTFLANKVNGPILLTDNDRLSPVTAEALSDLGAERVHLLGGSAAISTGVEAELSEDYEVSRIGGENRFETAAQIATSGDPLDVGTLGTSGRTAIIARGDDFADALAGGPVSFAGSFPLLLTDSDSLSGEAQAALDELEIQYVLVFGGEAAVSSTVVDDVEAMGITVQRLGGENRMETSGMIGEFAQDQLGFALEEAQLARGDLFPDALAGGPHAGLAKTPILLTQNPDVLSEATADWLSEHSDTVRAIEAYGGPAAISDDTLADAVAAATTS